MNPTTNQPDHNPTNSRRAELFALSLPVLFGFLNQKHYIGNRYE